MGADIKSLRNRIKSVDSTLHLTKAMGLVASSKIRRATENMQKSRQYMKALSDAVDSLTSSPETKKSPYLKANDNEKICLIVIAGDRGLAGGYNSNIFRLTEALSKDKDAVYLPIGKKALEYYTNRGRDVFSSDFGCVTYVGVGGAFNAASIICDAFRCGDIANVILVYTKFVSMISQLPVYEELLPLEIDENERNDFTPDPVFEGDAEELLEKIIPEYVGGIIYSAVCESLASESGARRSSMNAANKNAAEMIDALMLKYNRARQAVITQEITEIVSGSEAL